MKHWTSMPTRVALMSLATLFFSTGAADANLPRCKAQVEHVQRTVEEATDETIDDAAASLSRVTRACLREAVVALLDGPSDWKATRVVVVARVVSPEIQDRLFEILIERAFDGGFHDLQQALTVQASDGGRRAMKRFLRLLRSKHDGLPKETAIEVLAAGPWGYAALKELASIAANDLDETMRETARDGISNLITTALLRGDKITISPTRGGKQD